MSAQYSQYDGTQRRGMVPPPPPPRFHNQQPLSFPTQQSHQQHAERRNNNRKPYSRGRDGRKYEEEMGGRNFFTDEEVNLLNTVDELRQEIAQLKQTEAEIKTRERLYNVIIDSYHESTVAANSQYATQWYNPTEKINNLQFQHAGNIFSKSTNSDKVFTEKLLACINVVLNNKNAWMQAQMHSQIPCEALFSSSTFNTAVKSLTKSDKGNQQLDIILAGTALIIGEIMRAVEVTPNIAPVPLPININMRIPDAIKLINPSVHENLENTQQMSKEKMISCLQNVLQQLEAKKENDQEQQVVKQPDPPASQGIDVSNVFHSEKDITKKV